LKAFNAVFFKKLKAILNALDSSCHLDHVTGSNFSIDTIGKLVVNGVGSTVITSPVSLDIVSPNVNIIGSLTTSSGLSTIITVGSLILTFSDGILVGVAEV
jgi:hypothetical protein